MSVKSIVSRESFISAFTSSQYKDNFSLEALEALYNQQEENIEYFRENLPTVGATTEEIKRYFVDLERLEQLDPTMTACEWSEYDGFQELQREYSSQIEDCMDLEEAIETLRGYTTIIEVEDTERVLVAEF